MTKHLTFLRAYPTTIERTGQRQLTGRLVPYGVVTDVGDELPDGRVDIYREGFRAGAFSPQADAGKQRFVAKIGLVHSHDGGLGYLGPFTALREEADGLYGDVAILRSRADDVEDLLASGISELSVEFRVPKANATETAADGVRWRTRAHLDQVALEAKGAYGSARVLAYRAEVDEAQRQDAEEAAEEQRRTDKANAEAQLEEKAKRAAEAAAERRRRFTELAARLEPEQERQRQLVHDYGLTQPGSRFSR
jgi:HK97 family phage prohead protease